MNEVATCTQIALGIAATARSSGEPVGLIDIGTGSGLGLQLDRYRYRLGSESPEPGLSPGPGLSSELAPAELILSSEARGSCEPPPPDLPPIAERTGIDIAPVDLRDPQARAWLLACAPPEASALARLAAALYSGSAWASYWEQTVAELRPRLVASGTLDDRSIDRFLARCMRRTAVVDADHRLYDRRRPPPGSRSLGRPPRVIGPVVRPGHSGLATPDVTVPAPDS